MSLLEEFTQRSGSESGSASVRAWLASAPSNGSASSAGSSRGSSARPRRHRQRQRTHSSTGRAGRRSSESSTASSLRQLSDEHIRGGRRRSDAGSFATSDTTGSSRTTSTAASDATSRSATTGSDSQTLSSATGGAKSRASARARRRHSDATGCSNSSRSGSACKEFASDGAEILSMACLVERIAQEVNVGKSQRRTDMGIVQAARQKLGLPYEMLTLKEEALRIAAHLDWNVLLDEDRAAALERLEIWGKAKRVAVKQAMRQLRSVLVRQDQQKNEQMQMEILESKDSAKKKAKAIAAMPSCSELPTSPRAVLAVARERLALPDKSIHTLDFDDLLQEAQQVCFSYGIAVQLPDSPRADGAPSARSGTTSIDDGGSVAPSSSVVSTVVSTVDSVTQERNKMQDRIDGALGTSNLDVIRGVLYDAKHFDGELGYERPLEHLRGYAKDLGISSSESDSDDSSALLGSDSSDTDEADEDEDEDEDEDGPSPVVGSTGGEMRNSGLKVEATGPRGLDNISKRYDREVAALASSLTYVQGSVREQKDPVKTLRRCLLTVLRSEYEFDQLKQRGLRPVAMGSVSAHGKEDRTRTTWVMSLRGVKFYCGVETKAELQEILNKIETAYRTQANRSDSVRARKKEILLEKQYPPFQIAMADLLQLPEFPDEQEFRMELQKSVEATLTDIYSQAQPKPERFDSLLVDATDTVAQALRMVHSTFIESKQRHAATKAEDFESAVAELVSQLPATDSVEADERNRAKFTKQLRIALIDPDPKRYDKLVESIAPVARSALENARDAFVKALGRIEADAQRRKFNAGWLESIWKGVAPEKEKEDATMRELRRIKKALTRGRRGAIMDKQAIVQEEQPRMLAEIPAAERPDDDENITKPTAAAAKQDKMVTLEEAYELICAKLNIDNDRIVALTPIEILHKARDQLALPVIELTATNLEKETRMVCLGLGIRIEDEDYRELKNAQSYRSGRGRRAAMQTIGLIQKGTKWQAGGMSAKDGKIWWCSNCNYKNAPRWRCSMCGHRNNEMATEATPPIYSTRTHSEPSAERRALNSMQTVVVAAKARADAARKIAEEEQSVAQAAAQAAAAEEAARNRDAAVAAEREAAAHQEWIAKAAERTALAVADAARKEQERRETLAERVRQVMEEDLESNRERRKEQLQRLEKKMAMRVGFTSGVAAATAPQLGVFNSVEAIDVLPGTGTSTGASAGQVERRAAGLHGTAVPFLATQLDEIASLSALANGYEAEAQKAQVMAADSNRHPPGSSGGERQYVLADVHDPLGLQLATIRKLQQRSPPAGAAGRQAQAEPRLVTPDDVRFMRTTLSLEATVPQMDSQNNDARRRRRSPSRHKGQRHRTQQRAGLLEARAVASHANTSLEPYSAMTKEHRRVLQKRSRRYGHLHTNYDMRDRQGETLLVTV